MTIKKKSVEKKSTKKPAVKKVAKKKLAKKKPTREEREILYPEIQVQLCVGDTALSAEQAKEILGWEEEGEEQFSEFLLRDEYGKKIVCLHDDNNRPLNKPNYLALKQELLRGRWRFNGDSPINIGKTGRLNNGQHQLIALVLANQEIQKYPDKWPAVNNGVTMDKLVVTGVEESDEIVNTIDVCRPRSLSDVIYRSGFFQDRSMKDRKVVSKLLSQAVVTVWNRTIVGTTRELLKRTHAECLDFVDRHPKLLDCAVHVFEEDTEKNLGTLIQPGLLVGLMYLMSAGKTNPKNYQQTIDPTEELLDMDLYDKASDFIALLAGKAEETRAISKAISKLRGGEEEEECYAPQTVIAAIVTKAWLRYVDNKPITESAIQPVFHTDQDGFTSLAENPTLGGVDEGSVKTLPDLVEPELTEEEVKQRTAELRKKKSKARSGQNLPEFPG